MGVNKYKCHVWVVPEDDATRQLANGFLLHPSLDGTCIQVRPPSGGWARVLEDFETHQVANLRGNSLLHLAMLIDFDEQVETRTAHFRGRIPDDVLERVYILGARNEPEPLRQTTGKSLEMIGRALATACADGEAGLWDNELLRHNAAELVRLTASVKPFLFR